MILSEGDFHLRLVFCEDTELESDVYEDAIQFDWKQLKNEYDERMQAISEQWIRKKEKLRGILGVGQLFYTERLP